MRGKVIGGFGVLVQIGITPAYAGKSGRQDHQDPHRRDHPRVCGEKHIGMFLALLVLGSPPRVRGKVPRCCSSWLRFGITPAYAGKSSLSPPSGGASRDHPRVCGEKTPDASSTTKNIGSPPRMRGKAKRQAGLLCAAGITPAYAGKSPGMLSRAS